MQSEDPRDGGPRPQTTAPASPEAAERAAAFRRGERRADGGARARDATVGVADPAVAHRAFAALADNVRDYAIFLLDADGIITFWGEGARLIKWWTRDQAEGAHLRLLYPDGGSEDGTAEAHLRESARTGEYTGEGHRMRSDGSTFWAGITLTALRDLDGTLLGFAKVTRDLTAWRALEAARADALETAQEASRLKSLFLATMSHEIRTPLNAIMAYADILGMELGGPLSPVQHDQLGKIRASSQHLLGIVDDVLDLSRTESGRMVVGRSVLRVGDVVSQALVLVDAQAAERRVELADAVSGFAAGEHCWGDEERVRQVLVNLLGNAIKFTDPGGRITISAGSAAEPPRDARLEGGGPWVYVRVEDTGRGIAPDRLEAIFEAFVQADMTLTRQHGGTGLGLAISRRLARLMGGDLTVRSEEGVGSTFLLWLPAAPQEGPEGDAEGAPGGSAGILREVRDAVLGQLERILHGYVSRLRSDPATPGARLRSEAELEDHLASFLSDLAQTIGALAPRAEPGPGEFRDGTAIQRTIAQRHGQQRARLGWREDEIRREFEVLADELSAAVRRRVRRPREEEVEEALDLVRDLVGRARRISVEAYRAEKGE